MRRSWLRQHNGLLLSLRTCTVAPHQGLVSNPNPSQTCTVAPHQGASAATKQTCPHRSSMSDVIAPPGRGARGVRARGVGPSGGGMAERWEVKAGEAVVDAPWQRPRWLSASGPKRAMPVSVSVSGCQK